MSVALLAATAVAYCHREWQGYARSGASVVVAFVLAVYALCAPPLARAQSSGSGAYLTVDGEVTTPTNYSKMDFNQLPRMTIKTHDADGHDATYEGVDLSELLKRAGVPLQQSLKGADVAKYLHVEGRDGFVAVISLPEFDQGRFLLADLENGSPLPRGAGPLQLISPNEMRRSRWVKNLWLLRVKKSVK